MDHVTLDRLASLLAQWERAREWRDDEAADRIWTRAEDTVMDALSCDQVAAREWLRSAVQERQAA